jgi:SpoVK/Ycf46/Vps4 family AAA+-type ATPase
MIAPDFLVDPQTALTEAIETPVGAYRDAWAHLHDELNRLAIRIALRTHARHHRRPADPLDPFKGVVISDSEIAALLHDVTAPPQPSAPGAETSAGSDPEMRGWIEALAEADACIDARIAATRQAGASLPLLELCRLFKLSPFEAQCLIIALAPEIDRRYERLYAYLQDDATCRRPSIGLALDLLCGSIGSIGAGSIGAGSLDEALAVRAAFDPEAPLFRYHLCEPQASQPLLARPLIIDDRIVSFLLGRRDRLDPRLDGLAQLRRPDAEPGPVFIDESLHDRVCDFVDACFESEVGRRGIIIHLRGARGSGKHALAESICRRAELPLVTFDLRDVVSREVPFEEAIRRVCREALLQPAALCISGFDLLAADPDTHRAKLNTLVEAIGTFARLTFLLGNQAWTPAPAPPTAPAPGSFISVTVPPPDARASRRLWDAYLAREGMADDVDSATLSGRFRLGSGRIHHAIVTARDQARWRAPHDPRVTMMDLTIGCRAVTTPRLAALARHVTSRHDWADLVLPADPLAQLQELCHHARYRHVVFDDWGFDRKLSLGKGLSVLFAGPPGTGKTMAAAILAQTLQLDLYQIDLSQVVSKYVGETEKNLSQVFDEADASQAILFFDEADALFGKRSEVKDAHDRYANIEIGYLLQRMEAYQGVAILATNLKQHLDDAFVRRLRFIIEFPFPDEAHRRRIWEVTFPREAPLGADVDLAALARDLRLPGGSIRNIVLAAAFAAAADGGVIGMPHLLQAAQREHQKLGRAWTGLEER